ncbi:MAG: nucleoside triphosphate pyrophosphohydrolase [candidate division Zixibacteria bacterium]|nr:nucleoside triphosphate pyrophosphohydrolase [candidate division Zixibacteria bacterium]
MEQFKRLVEIMAKLRGPDGCPWDKAQDHKSLKPYLIEEAYEVLDAIDSGESEKLAEELGDLLLHIVFHARMAAENDKFDIEIVCKKINDKLIQRHPHIFHEKTELSKSRVLDQWEAIKQNNNKNHSVLEGVPRAMPALLKAYRIQEKVGRLGFDWKEAKEVVDKIKEEVAEFEEAFENNDKQAMHHELGDLLFSLVNLSRHLGLRAEEALDDTNKKFIKRFKYIEKKLAENGKSPADSNLEEMDAFWEESKKEIK